MLGADRPLGVLRVGDEVLAFDQHHRVVELEGNAVRLADTLGNARVVLLPELLAAPDFAVIGNAEAARLPPLGLLDALPVPVLQRARWWEVHVIEVETGQRPLDAQPRPMFDPATTTVGDRQDRKLAELAAAGHRVSAATFHRMRARYRSQGLWGLVDQRSVRTQDPLARADPRLVSALSAMIEAETNESTGTRARLQQRVQHALDAEHGPGVVPVPSRSTFNRMVAAMTAGRHTFGAATTRRSLANRPDGPFSPTYALRPGEQVQIDTTALDVMAVMDDGSSVRAELTIAVDIATRTLCAAALRPAATKAVDAALLLARMLVPEALRPNWPAALAMSSSVLPHEQLSAVDPRLAQAAAKPVIVPETIVCDHGKVFVSETFTAACSKLGISVQPAHKYTPTDKGVVERTFGSINTLFCQYVAGNTGSNPTRRGRPIEGVWSVRELAEMLDKWIVAGWQNRPHEGLRHPRLPGRALSRTRCMRL